VAEKKSFDVTQVLSIEDIIEMIKATSDTRDRAILLLLYKTGIRVGELINLNLENVSLDKGTIRMPMSMKKEQRDIYFDEECGEALKAWISVRVSNGNNALFIDNGERLKDKSVETLVKETANRSGIQILVTPQTFRRTFAYHLVFKGCNRSIIDTLGEKKSLYLTYRVFSQRLGMKLPLICVLIFLTPIEIYTGFTGNTDKKTSLYKNHNLLTLHLQF
jgi:site-specific recombinase XerD